MRQKTNLILKEARYLVKAGWCQNTLEVNGCYCAIGAIQEAAHRHGQTSALAILNLAKGIVETDLNRPLSPSERIMVFNDKAERHKGDVLALFNMAIASG